MIYISVLIIILLHLCLCRKPNSLMIEKAIAKHNIETSLSYFGDNERDILAAEKVMIKGIIIESNTNILPRVKMDILNVVLIGMEILSKKVCLLTTIDL